MTGATAQDIDHADRSVRDSMSKRLLGIAVYPLLLVNLALGFLMFTLTHQFILVLADVLRRGGVLEGEHIGPFSYVQRSLSGFGVVILGPLVLIFFSIVESYYSRATAQGLLLLWRFLRVVGIQLLYLGGLSAAIRLMVGSLLAADTGILLITVQIAGGAGLLIYANNRITHAAAQSDHGQYELR